MYVDPRSMPGEPTAASYEFLACEGIELNFVVLTRVQALELGSAIQPKQGRGYCPKGQFTR